MANDEPGILQRVKRWPVVVLLLALAGVLGSYIDTRQASSELAHDVDSLYHGRSAATALIQLARVPDQTNRDVVRYMATLQNLSDAPLIVTAVINEAEQVMGAVADTGTADPNVGEAAMMRPTGTYDIVKACKMGAWQPLVPPYRIQPHATGSFEIKVRRDQGQEPSWCISGVRFQTNQGETNSIIPND